MVEPSPRLQKCLEAGSLLNVFPLLKGWSRSELKALMKDADDYYQQRGKEIQEGWEEICLLPEVVFDKALAKKVDDARQRKFLDLIAFTSEVCSVALLYLKELKP